jgi:hypothetical protein
VSIEESELEPAAWMEKTVFLYQQGNFGSDSRWRWFETSCPKTIDKGLGVALDHEPNAADRAIRAKSLVWTGAGKGGHTAGEARLNRGITHNDANRYGRDSHETVNFRISASGTQGNLLPKHRKAINRD